MTITVKTLSPSEIQSAILQSNQITNAAVATVTGNQFVFFAAFDGTRNDRNNLALSGDPKSTNVAQIFEQVRDGNLGNASVVPKYYKGVGTIGTWDPTVVIPTSEIRATAELAYSEFNKAASDWLAVNPSGEVRAMLATFSRGGSTGAVFSQILFERGITNPISGDVLVAPGSSLISGGVIMDTIAGALRVLGNIKGLDDAFKTGNLGRVLTNGGSLSIPALGIFSEYLRQQIIAEFGSVGAARVAIDDGSELAVKIVGTFDGVNALLEDVVAGLPYLNIAVSLAEGDYKGAAISYIAIENPFVAIFLAAIDYLYTVAMEHQYEASGRFVGGANGAITIQIDSVNGGAGAAFAKNMQTMLDQTKKQAAMDAERLGEPMGVIAERLPTIEYKRDVMFLRFKDPLSGASYVRTFDLGGKYLAPGITPENVATYEYRTRARGLFDVQFGVQSGIAANDGAWEVAA